MIKRLLYVSILFSFIFLIGSAVNAEESSQETESTEDSGLNLAEEAKSAILIEQDTGEILFEKNADKTLPPASMTKIMTLLLIMEEIEAGQLDLNDVVHVSERAASMGGSQVFLEAGEEMAVRDLLKGIAVASGNDASVAMAEEIAGTEEAFVQKMNEKAEELNLTDTTFQNVTGLPAEDHYSTASDMAVMAQELLKHEEITEYTSIYEDYLREGEENEFWLVNTNRLVKSHPHVDGLKTGYTNEAKYCLTASAKQGDMRVIAVVMGAESPKERNAAVTGMVDYALSNYETQNLLDKGEKVTEIEALKAENRVFNIITAESISLLHRKNEAPEDIQMDIKLNEDLELPIGEGEHIGVLTVKSGESILSETPLTVNEQVNAASYLTLLKRSLQELVKFQ